MVYALGLELMALGALVSGGVAWWLQGRRELALVDRQIAALHARWSASA